MNHAAGSGALRSGGRISGLDGHALSLGLPGLGGLVRGAGVLLELCARTITLDF